MNKQSNNPELDQLRRLLEALYRQRAELGDIAAELISLLEAAGVSIPDPADKSAGHPLPKWTG